MENCGLSGLGSSQKVKCGVTYKANWIGSRQHGKFAGEGKEWMGAKMVTSPSKDSGFGRWGGNLV